LIGSLREGPWTREGGPQWVGHGTPFGPDLDSSGPRFEMSSPGSGVGGVGFPVGVPCSNTSRANTNLEGHCMAIGGSGPGWQENYVDMACTSQRRRRSKVHRATTQLSAGSEIDILEYEIDTRRKPCS
jgi:hypothetical protein